MDIESTIAQSASGKAGGFLARGWHGGGPTRELHEVGFDLLREFCSGTSSQTVTIDGEAKYKTARVPSYRQIDMYSVEHVLDGSKRRRLNSKS